MHTRRLLRSAALLAIGCSPLSLAACSGGDEAAGGEPLGPAQCVLAAIPDREMGDQLDLTFVKGPYLMHTTSSSATMMWESGSECDGRVDYGLDPEHLTSSASHDGVSMIHEVAIGGLQPATRYYYRVTSCSMSSQPLDFFSAPNPAEPVRFTVWGDSRSNPDKALMVVRAMKRENPYFTIHTGDVVAVGGLDGLWTAEFFDPLRALGHHVPTYIAIGNHEGDADAFYNLVSYPVSLADDPRAESYYSFTYGNVFFVVIDTNKIFYDLSTDEAGEMPISRWIKDELASEAAAGALWRVAVGHEPAWSESWSPGSCSYDGTPMVRNWLMPLLAQHQFHAYFAGHTHAYERGMKDGVLHVISGGGGAELDEWCKDMPEVDVVKLRYSYVKVDAGCDRMVVSAHDVEAGGQEMDRVVLDADRWGEVSEVSVE